MDANSIFNQHYSTICKAVNSYASILRHRTGCSPMDAENFRQDAFLFILRHCADYDPSRSTPYFYFGMLVRTAYCKATNKIMRANRHIVTGIEVDATEPVIINHDISEVREVAARVGGIAPRALELRLEGRKLRECAQELGVSHQRVAQVLGRVKVLCRESEGIEPRKGGHSDHEVSQRGGDDAQNL